MDFRTAHISLHITVHYSHTKHSHIGYPLLDAGAFAVHVPMVWNSLPDDLCAQQDYESFRQGLKPGFSPDISVFNALETFVITALYKSTFTIRYHATAQGSSGA